MPALIEALERALGQCERLFLALANLCLAIMLFANMANIASRALFDKGIIYVFPWSIVLFVWMTFLGFFVVYRRGKDITVDFLIDRIGTRARVASRLLVDVLVIGLMLVMLIQAPHIVRHDEYPQGVAFMVNAAAYQGLSPELREAVDKAYADASAFSVEAMEQVTAESIERMKEDEVTYDEIDTGPFVDRMKTFYAELDKSGELPEGFLDAVNASR